MNPNPRRLTVLIGSWTNLTHQLQPLSTEVIDQSSPETQGFGRNRNRHLDNVGRYPPTHRGGNIIADDEGGTAQGGLEVAIAGAARDALVVPTSEDFYPFYDVQVKSTVADTHGTARVIGVAK